MTASPRPPGAAGGLALSNPRVQRLRRLVRQPRARSGERAFVVEGEKLVAAALAAGAAVESVYVASGWDGAVSHAARSAGVPVRVLAPGVLDRVAGTVSPQPVIAVVEAVDVELDSVAGASLVVVCVDVRDPGNLGAVLRSALAAGAVAVVCCDGCADAYNPKCVRASAGALFHLEIVRGGAVVEVLDELGSHGMRRFGARASGGARYDTVDLRPPTAIVVGNEGHGLPAEVERALDGVLTIPMAPSSESLNVGAAAAVLCFEVARQRRVPA